MIKAVCLQSGASINGRSFSMPERRIYEKDNHIHRGTGIADEIYA